MITVFLVFGICYSFIEKKFSAEKGYKAVIKQFVPVIIMILIFVYMLCVMLIQSWNKVEATIENQDGEYYYNHKTQEFYEAENTKVEILFKPFAFPKLKKLEEAPEWFYLNNHHSYVCTCGYVKGDTRWSQYCPECGKEQNPKECSHCEKRLSWTETMCSECGKRIKE